MTQTVVSSNTSFRKLNTLKQL